MDSSTAPPPDVLDAFGATAIPQPLSGGKGGTWRSGDLVLKPAEGEAEALWRAGILSALPGDPAFRMARPVAAHDGRWLVRGWEASRFVAGIAVPTRVDEVVRVGERFHAALAHVPRPSFLDRRTDPWAHADRLAWDEPVPDGATRPSPLLEALLGARRTVDVPAQVVHGDLLGNVLFADGLPPAVIDWAVYWRPPAWAAAVAVVDAMCWHGAGPETITRWSSQPQWTQMLLRALIYRIATRPQPGHAEPESAYRPVVDEVLRTAHP